MRFLSRMENVATWNDVRKRCLKGYRGWSGPWWEKGCPGVQRWASSDTPTDGGFSCQGAPDGLSPSMPRAVPAISTMSENKQKAGLTSGRQSPPVPWRMELTPSQPSDPPGPDEAAGRSRAVGQGEVDWGCLCLLCGSQEGS